MITFPNAGVYSIFRSETANNTADVQHFWAATRRLCISLAPRTLENNTHSIMFEVYMPKKSTHRSYPSWSYIPYVWCPFEVHIEFCHGQNTVEWADLSVIRIIPRLTLVTLHFLGQVEGKTGGRYQGTIMVHWTRNPMKLIVFLELRKQKKVCHKLSFSKPIEALPGCLSM
jgi:hypothetical protein